LSTYSGLSVDSHGKRQQERPFVGESGAHRIVLQNIKTVACRKTTVLLLGETGTGKEMAARQIHSLSHRAHKAFIPIDCTALNGQILESQLFGHVKGAFTGAIRDSAGFFRAADGGTVFLDEISELELNLQAKLLRVLQESCVTPLGSTDSYPVDIRLICAANRDLKSMVRLGTFRADLYFRISIFKIELPPLWERREDIILLAKHFLQKQAALYQEEVKEISPEAEHILNRYDWPGNVRELANVMEYAHVNCTGPVIEPCHLPVDILCKDAIHPLQGGDFMSFEDLQKRLVLRALEKTRGHKMAAARLLKIDHRKLERLVKKWNMEPTWKGCAFSL